MYLKKKVKIFNESESNSINDIDLIHLCTY